MRPNFAAAEFFFSVVDFIGSPLREPLRIVKEFLACILFSDTQTTTASLRLLPFASVTVM